jgi:hypothetical protein
MTATTEFVVPKSIPIIFPTASSSRNRKTDNLVTKQPGTGPPY